MKKEQKPLDALCEFIPENTYPLLLPYFKQYPIRLILTRERKTVMGDYRSAFGKDPYHQITVNINLNPYSFLITLVHELAHLLTHIHFPRRVSPHGPEWKTQFRHVLMPFLGKKIFPRDIEKALIQYIQNPTASTCSDPALFKALYRYDLRKPDHLLIDSLQVGDRFISENKIYEVVQHRRTRTHCIELGTRKSYLFPRIFEVAKWQPRKRHIA